MKKWLPEGDDSDPFIHPRKYIWNCGFKEGDEVDVWVKDKQNPALDDDAHEWYSKAFGP